MYISITLAFEPGETSLNFSTLPNSEDPDQPVHERYLITNFAIWCIDFTSIRTTVCLTGKLHEPVIKFVTAASRISMS